ncbi:hypothetical protein GN156_15570 [bacterium LRH843]|nr:hypothetical protein [bacterium LRH843]
MKVMRISWIVVLFILVSSSTIYATNSERNHVLVVIVPDFSFEEARFLLDRDGDNEVWKNASIGAMNVRPNGPYSYLNNILAFSTGEKIVGTQNWNSYEAGDMINGVEISDWSEQVGGKKYERSIVHPYFHQLVLKNSFSTIGRLGSQLRDGEVTRSVYGHSDAGEKLVRYGSLLVMDDNGEATGELAKAVKEKRSSPYGLEMDIDYIMSKLSTEVANRQLTVIEWGDIYRLFAQKPFMDEQYFQKQKEQHLFRLSSFLDRVLLAKGADEIWLIAPMMNKQAYDRKQLLAPTFHWGKERGYLTSNTTKQPYLISSLDFAPTILQSFGIAQKNEWTGHVITTDSGNDVEKKDFFKKVDEIVLIYKSRASVLSIYISCLVIALIGAAVFNFFIKGNQKTWKFVIKLLLLSALWSPFWLLALSKSTQMFGISRFILVLICLSILCGYAVYKLSSRPIFLVGLMTFLLITVDTVMGSPLMQRSYLGYDPIIGARYYGIGNEYAGVYLISALMMLHPLFNEGRKWITGLSCLTMLFVLVFILGKNTLGTNAGATLSAAIAFSFLLYQVLGLKWSWRKLSLAIGSAIVAGFFILFFLQLTGEQSHIGAAFQRLWTGDFVYIIETIKRKLSMNLKLFKYSNWTQLLVTSYVLGAIILWTKQWRIKEKGQRLFLQTGIVCSFALLLLNDSGVVAAATSMFCVVSAYFTGYLKTETVQE